MQNHKMVIEETDSLTQTQKQMVMGLWNTAYPAQLAYKNEADFDVYLSGLKNCKHFMAINDASRIVGWAMCFERNEEIWFAIIVDIDFQGKGAGSHLLNCLKQDQPILNGWVIDHPNYIRSDGIPYLSPLAFYVKHGFEVNNEIRLEIPILSAVKVVWQKAL